MACANGHINILEALLKINTSLINEKNTDGNTPLHWAVISNKKEIVEILLKHEVLNLIYRLIVTS